MSAENAIPIASSATRALNDLDNCDETEFQINPVSEELSSSGEETGPVLGKKRGPFNFSDSESDIDSITSIEKITENAIIINRSLNSDSNSGDIGEERKYESIRTGDKKKLKEKFRSISLKTKNMPKLDKNLPMSDDYNNANSDEEVSCLNIKEKIKKSIYSIKSICDPDTSDEESNDKRIYKPKSNSCKTKSQKPTSKPLRMSAKQAMENMHKIKSESNRMLREKEVSLPYHRPKALALKDIMNRRKPAVTSDGKALPIKMNKEQLEQYVLLLEERQKEVIELCKSDSEKEEEIDNAKSDENVTLNVITEPCLEDIKVNNNISSGEIDLSNDKSNVNNQRNVKSDCQYYSDEQINTPMESPINENNNVNDLCETESDRVGSGETKILSENSFGNKVDISTQELESQIINLHYESERESLIQDSEQNKSEINTLENSSEGNEEELIETPSSKAEDLLDNIDLIDCDEIEKLIENAETICGNVENKNEISEKSFFSRIVTLPNPKLTGTPGTFINLDDSDTLAPKEITGVDLLKERFTYYAKLKSLEDMETDREKKFKPGTQHLKLKKELENQIAEQKSMEWEKRLEEEKKLRSEINEPFSDDDIEKLESKLETIEEDKLNNKDVIAETSEGEEEPIENDIILVDKPKKLNPLVDDEAEESDCDEDVACDDSGTDVEQKDNETDDDANSEGEDDDTNDSSSESEEVETNSKKRRILKAFEDSDDECVDINSAIRNQERNDEELQLAQINKSSDDLFSTQEPDLGIDPKEHSEDHISPDLGTQTFSILDSVTVSHKVNLNSQEASASVCETPSQDDINLNVIVETCLDSFSQNLESTQNKSVYLSQTQEIGDDAVALCTGKFYDNPFVSQVDNIEKNNSPINITQYAESQEIGDDIAVLCTGKFYDNPFLDDGNKEPRAISNTTQNTDDVNKDENQIDTKSIEAKSILNSILEELDGPDFDRPKNKYFVNDTESNKCSVENVQYRKRLVIDSDDEINDGIDYKNNKKRKKRKAEQRALQISDDEEESEVDNNDFESDVEEVEDRIVEYDSEENEVEVQQKTSKKKRVDAFFENEAELTSEDEWMGSGDEDERGLDRMEREEGDNETFNQGQLRRELGQIHMREVLDQDKREVRLIQELLFEDGDLGDGHRQRKFRWRNADGDEETGTNPDEFLDTQEDEFESEEQWRKQRHEREMFLRKLQEKDDVNLDTSVNRTAIIKANLCSRSISMLSAETKTKIDKEDTVVPEKRSVKDIPSPKKSFTILQQNYHKSLLTRGRGALARLAALATPLATDNDDAPKVVTSNRRNFVFAAISQDEQPKLTKRKAENIHTPRLIKKMKTDDTNKHYKSTLLDHLKT